MEQRQAASAISARVLELGVDFAHRFSFPSHFNRSKAPPRVTGNAFVCARARGEGGRILIDGQDVSETTQESLRAQISMITQDTSLLHRSIRENIRYGRPQASEAEERSSPKPRNSCTSSKNCRTYRQNRFSAQNVWQVARTCRVKVLNDKD